MGKLLVYMAPVNTLGDNTTNTPAVGILAKYDYVILAPHTGADIPNLTETLRAVKIANPDIKVFGYTNFGEAASTGAWEALVTAWTTNTNFPTESLLDGIYLDKFGFENTLATRANQNTAISFCHGLDLSVIVNSQVPMNAINKYTGQTDSLLGADTLVKDYILLEGFYFAKVALATATSLEPKDALFGRLDYTTGARDNSNLNLGILGVADMVNEIQVPILDYKAILELSKAFKLDAVGFAPQDYGATSHDYFLGKNLNDFTG